MPLTDQSWADIWTISGQHWDELADLKGDLALLQAVTFTRQNGHDQVITFITQHRGVKHSLDNVRETVRTAIADKEQAAVSIER